MQAGHGGHLSDNTVRDVAMQAACESLLAGGQSGLLHGK